MSEDVASGEKLFWEGRIADAEARFLAAAAKNPRDESAYNNLGVTAFKMMEAEKAAGYLIRALVIDPFYKEAIINYAEVSKGLNSVEAVIPWIEKYLSRYPRDEEMLRLYFEAHRRAGGVRHGWSGKDGLEYWPERFLVCAVENNEVQEQVEQIEKFLQHDYVDGCTGHEKRNKAHRNYLLTGIPGSEIGVFQEVLNGIEDVVCIKDTKVDGRCLKEKFVNIRIQSPEKRNGKGVKENMDLVTGPCVWKNMRFHEDIVVGIRKDIGPRDLVSWKTGKLRDVQWLFQCEYRVIGIIRDPLFTIAEWNRAELSDRPEAMVSDDNMSDYWKDLRFTSGKSIERQAQVWQGYAEMLWQLSKWIRVYTYEQIVSDSIRVLKEVCEMFTLPFPEEFRAIGNQNITINGMKIKEIEDAIKRYCPIRKKFGYVDDGKNEVFWPEILNKKDEGGELIDYRDVLDKFLKMCVNTQAGH